MDFTTRKQCGQSNVYVMILQCKHIVKVVISQCQCGNFERKMSGTMSGNMSGKCWWLIGGGWANKKLS